MKIRKLIRESILNNLFGGLESFPDKGYRCQFNSFGWIDQDGNIIDLLKLGFKDHDSAHKIEGKMWGTKYIKVNNALSYNIESGKLESLNINQIRAITEIILDCQDFLQKQLKDIFKIKIDFWYESVDHEIDDNYFDKITIFEFFDKVKERNVDSIKEIERIENNFYEKLGL